MRPRCAVGQVPLAQRHLQAAVAALPLEPPAVEVAPADAFERFVRAAVQHMRAVAHLLAATVATGEARAEHIAAAEECSESALEGWRPSDPTASPISSSDTPNSAVAAAAAAAGAALSPPSAQSTASADGVPAGAFLPLALDHATALRSLQGLTRLLQRRVDDAASACRAALGGQEVPSSAWTIAVAAACAAHGIDAAATVAAAGRTACPGSAALAIAHASALRQRDAALAAEVLAIAYDNASWAGADGKVPIKALAGALATAVCRLRRSHTPTAPARRAGGADDSLLHVRGAERTDGRFCDCARLRGAS